LPPVVLDRPFGSAWILELAGSWVTVSCPYPLAKMMRSVQVPHDIDVPHPLSPRTATAPPRWRDR